MSAAALLSFRRPQSPAAAPATDPYAVGCRVSYEDMANPRTVFVIVGEHRGPYASGLRVVTEDGTRESTIHRGDIEGPGGWRAEPGLRTNPQAVAYLIRRADHEREHRAKRREEDRLRLERERVAGREFLKEHRPIVAELVQDESDPQTDYFATRTLGLLMLGWSKHTRDLFPELRKAAQVAPETADLALAPASAENREKYSMGHGYYLGASAYGGSGWRVRKVRLGSYGLSELEGAIGRDPSAYRAGRLPS